MKKIYNILEEQLSVIYAYKYYPVIFIKYKFRENIFMLRLLLIFLFAYSINCDCPIWPYPRQTVVGEIDIEVNYDQKLDNKSIQSNYPLKDPFQENAVSVAIAIHGFQLNAPNGLNFFVENLPITQTNLLKFRTQIIGSGSWRILSFTFLATQSPLFLISTYTINQFSTGGQPGKYSIYRPIINFNSFLASPVIQVFLNGLELGAKPLDQEYNTMLRQYQSFKKFSTNQRLVISFQQALQAKRSITFNITGVKIISKLFTLTIQTNSQLRSIRFSSVLFSKVAVSEKHSYIINDFTLSNGNLYRFTGLTNMGMVFSGLLGFKFPRDQRYRNNLIFQNIQGQSSFDVQTNIKHFSLGYTFLALQMKQKFICQDCKDSPYIYDDKFCVGICPRSYSIMRRLENIYCQKCDIEQLKVVDLMSGQCVCAKRHYLQNKSNICKPCRYECMSCSQGNRCLTCDNNLLQTKRRLSNTGRCQCPSIGFYDDKASQNIVCQKCDSNCRTCNGPKYFDCLSCTNEKQLQPLGFCACRNSFVEDSAGNCGCNPPRTLINNICVDPNAVCSQNQTQQLVQLGKRCLCKPGFIQVKNDCIKCGKNAIFNQNQLSCKCVNKTVLIDGQCVACNSNQFFDEISQICLCRPGTFRTDSGTCITCPLKMSYINGNCECIYNYFEGKTGVCQRCLKQSDGPKCRRVSY